MVLVLGIIALLLGSGIYLLRGVVEDTEDQTVFADFQTLKTALVSYKTKSRVGYPTTEQGLAALVKRPSGPPPPKRWSSNFAKQLTDPWGKPYQYRYPAKRSKHEEFDLWSCGKDGIDGTEDDLGNWQLEE